MIDPRDENIMYRLYFDSGTGMCMVCLSPSPALSFTFVAREAPAFVTQLSTLILSSL